MKYVDLGLSVLWADCNIGAITPEEFGNYYKCCEIPKEYEIPTLEQYKELINNCNWEWTTKNGVNGYKVISKVNSNSIFLPAAGCRSDNYSGSICNHGYYRSSSLYTGISDDAYTICFNPGNVDWDCISCRCEQSVRPIKPKTSFKNKTTMTLKEVNEIFPLKSGMILKLEKNGKSEKIILFQYGKGDLCYTDYDLKFSWSGFDYYLNSNVNYDTIKVYQSPTDVSLFDDVDLIFNSDDYNVKELTMQEIADKFGIKLENLRIKD